MKRSQGIRGYVAREIILAGIRALAPALLALTVARPSLAEDLPPTRLEYRVPEGCPTVEEFSERVRRRSTRIQLVTEGSGLRTLVIEVIQDEQALKSSVRIVEIDGTERTRNLKAKDCTEAIDGLALIATVSLDPEAMLEVPPEPEPEPPRKPPPPPPVKKPPEPPPPKKPPPPKPNPNRWGVGVGAAGLFETAPKPMFGGTLAGTYEYRSGRVVSFMGRVSFTYGPEVIARRDFGVAGFQPVFGTLELCPLRFGVEWIGLHACGYTLAGVLNARGTDTVDGQEFQRFLSTLGGSLMAVLRFGETFEIVLDGMGGFALNQHRFRFAPDDDFWQMRLFQSSASLTLGVGFQ